MIENFTSEFLRDHPERSKQTATPSCRGGLIFKHREPRNLIRVGVKASGSPSISLSRYLSLSSSLFVFPSPPPPSLSLSLYLTLSRSLVSLKRLIDSCSTQLQAQGPFRTCNESQKMSRSVLPCPLLSNPSNPIWGVIQSQAPPPKTCASQSNVAYTRAMGSMHDPEFYRKRVLI